MAHVTGNATWVDYPSTATLVNAAKLNNLETVFDNLYTSEYGSVTRTKRTLFRAYFPTSFSLSLSTDQFMGAGWTVATDTDSGWVVGSPSYYQIPLSGRLWDIFFRLTVYTGWNAEGISAKITLNVASTGSTIAADTRRTTAGECIPTAYREAVQLTAGDKLYFAGWTNIPSGAVNPGVYFSGIVPEICVRDVGPA